jgi:hypothetical protein
MLKGLAEVLHQQRLLAANALTSMHATLFDYRMNPSTFQHLHPSLLPERAFLLVGKTVVEHERQLKPQNGSHPLTHSHARTHTYSAFMCHRAS